MRLLVIGPGEMAKMAFFRATADLWDHGSGRIVRPGGSCLFFLPERPYLPPGTLREILASPDCRVPPTDEKIHEVLVSEGEARTTWEYDDHYVVYPPFEWWVLDRHFHEGGRRVPEDFVYASDRVKMLTVAELKKRLADPESGGAR
jgi:hypothetical protein